MKLSDSDKDKLRYIVESHRGSTFTTLVAIIKNRFVEAHGDNWLELAKNHVRMVRNERSTLI